MATLHNSSHRHGDGEYKASSLTDSTQTTPTPGAPSAAEARKDMSSTALHRRDKRFFRTMLVDLITILLIVAAGFGAVCGYRWLQGMYAPEWDTRDVVYVVRFEGLPADMIPLNDSGKPALVGKPIYSSVTTDADLLGTVTDAVAVSVSHEDGSTSMTLQLTVQANARYREGKGYWMGNTRLLAGDSGTYRLESMSAEGLIISLNQRSGGGQSASN
jgi:hypothetical protein